MIKVAVCMPRNTYLKQKGYDCHSFGPVFQFPSVLFSFPSLCVAMCVSVVVYCSSTFSPVQYQRSVFFGHLLFIQY